ncbi:Uncharacterised protein [Shigella sonnei]|nr:Uncharacterised protein [Shigella sonnei]
MCDFRFVQHVGKPRRNDKQDNPNRQEAEEPLQPANLDTGNFADELQTQHVWCRTGDKHGRTQTGTNDHHPHQIAANTTRGRIVGE